MGKRFILVFYLLTPAFLLAQGYFYNEGTVTINGGSSIEIKGDAVVHQSINGNGFMVMNGDNPQTMGGSSANMNNLRVTNDANVTLVDPLWVNDTLAMNSGTIYLEDENIFLADNSFHSGNSTGFLETNGSGYVQRKLDATGFTFHMGYGNEYFPISLTENGTADTFWVQAWDLLPDDGTSSGVAVANHVALLSFSVSDQVNGGNDLSITMGWNDSKNAFDFEQHYAIGIWYNGSAYVEMDNCPTNVSNMDPNAVSYLNIDSVGTFGIGDSLYLSNIPTAYITPGDTSVCQGDTVTFTAMPAGAVNYLWSTSASTQAIDVTVANNYYVDITDAAGCTYRSDEVTLTTLALPTTPTILVSDTVLSVSPIYTTYQWYLNGNSIGGATGSSYSVAGNGTYSVVVTNANGCSATDQYIFNNFGIDDENVIVSIYNQQGQLYVHLDGDNAQQVIIYDALGKIVYNQPYTSDVIPLQLSHGMYVVKVNSSGKEYVKKIIW